MHTKGAPRGKEDILLSNDRLVLTRLSFCRKTTMVNHQRRSHVRRNGYQDDLDKYASDTDDEDMVEGYSSPVQDARALPIPPVVPSQHALLNRHPLSRTPSFTDATHSFDRHEPTYGADDISVTEPSYGYREPEFLPPAQASLLERTVSHDPRFVPQQQNHEHGSIFSTPEQHLVNDSREQRSNLSQESRMLTAINVAMQPSPSNISSYSGSTSLDAEPFYTHLPSQQSSMALQEITQLRAPIEGLHYPTGMMLPISQAQPAIIGREAHMRGGLPGNYRLHPHHNDAPALYGYPPLLDLNTMGYMPAYTGSLFDLYQAKLELDQAEMLPSARMGQA